GQAAPELPPGVALKIFTGAPVPANATAVVRKEDTREIIDAAAGNSIVLQSQVSEGQNIRARGENIRAGQVVLPAGQLLAGTKVVAAASFGGAEVAVHHEVRVCVLNTGDELRRAGAPVEPWQIRDSNGPYLMESLGRQSWLNVRSSQHVPDALEETVQAIENELETADAIILSGGVSMGDADYVPAAIKQLGGHIIFHRLPIRPGKPVLGAVVSGKLVLGCPGNPASVAVTARIFGLPLLSKLAGIRQMSDPVHVEVANPDDKTLPLYWYRLVRVVEGGCVELVAGRGSGDVVALAASDGIIAVPPGQKGHGPWPYYPW
ncbi:MAG TPA: molybdopterin molybdenumtransferase MoeA, partial [Planctomycetaceae bacterium]|nr:molybdopterin molybdenumtransferase MoeA [Planctomycetaceae bacterium]